MKPVLVQIQPLLPDGKTRITVRVGSAASPAAYGLGGVEWEPALPKRPSISQELFTAEMDGAVQAGTSSFTLDFNEMHNLPYPGEALYWGAAPVTIWTVDDLDWATRFVEFTGYVTTPELDTDRRSLSITATTPTIRLDVPLLTKTFNGLGGLDGEAAVRGTLLPAAFGIQKYIQPIWFDTTNNIGMIDGYGNTQSIDRMLQGGSDLGPAQADYPTYDALKEAILAATVPAGGWATCTAYGLVGLGASNSNIITVDGHFGGGTPGAFMQRVLSVHAGIEAALIAATDFDALDAAVQAVTGHAPATHYWTSSTRQVSDMLQAIAASCNASPIVTLQGMFGVTRAVATTPVMTLDRSGAIEPRVLDWQIGSVIAPYWELTARTNRPGVTLTTDQVLYAADLVDRGLYNSETIYYQGNIVWLLDKSEWLYTGVSPSSGHSPADSDAANWWYDLAPAIGAAYVAYEDGTSVEALKPAESSATNSADPDSAFGGKTVGYVLNSLGQVTERITDLDDIEAALQITIRSVSDLAQLTQTRDAIMQARTTLDGEAIGTVVTDVQTRTDDAVETLSLIGAKDAAGTSFNINLDTVKVDADTTLSQHLEDLASTSASGQVNAAVQQLDQAITDGDAANASSIKAVQATVGDLSTAVSFAISATEDANGDALSQAVLAVNANGRLSGIIAKNTGKLSTLDMDFDGFRMFKPDGTLLFRAGDTASGENHDDVYMPNVVVDTLKVNTAMVPVRVVAASYVAGTYSSTTGAASPRASILTVDVVVQVPGWIEVIAKLEQGLVGSNGSWTMAVAFNGIEDGYSNVGGGIEQDNVTTLASFYASAAGTYTVDLMWAAYTGIQARERVMFIKHFPGTE